MPCHWIRSRCSAIWRLLHFLLCLLRWNITVCICVNIYLCIFLRGKLEPECFFVGKFNNPYAKVDCRISHFSACNFNTPWTLGLNNDWFVWVMSDIDSLIHQWTPATAPLDPHHLQPQPSLFALHLLYFPLFLLLPPPRAFPLKEGCLHNKALRITSAVIVSSGSCCCSLIRPSCKGIFFFFWFTISHLSPFRAWIPSNPAAMQSVNLYGNPVI